MTLDPEKMLALRRRFVAAAGGQADQLDRLLQQGDYEGVRSIAHGLAGRSGMFGFSELGETAREVDEADVAAILEPTRKLLNALRQLANEG